MQERVSSWRLPPGGRRSTIAALAVLALVVVAAVVGGWLGPPDPAATPTGTARPTTVVLVGPAAGSRMLSTGQVSVLGLASGSTDLLVVE